MMASTKKIDEVPGIKIIIDGISLEVKKGTTILSAAASAGISIPTLCYYGGLEPFGACRVCVVELKNGNISKLVPACHYRIEKPVEVNTHSEQVLSSRRMTIELLLARCPDTPILKELSTAYGIAKSRFSPDNDDCILCGLCVRMCRELMKVEALSYIGRGWKRRIMPPYDKKSPVCISCGACAFVCPTNKIKIMQIYNGEVEENPSIYDEGLASRGNIFMLYPQQIPKVPVIDRDNCVKFKTGACGACEKICAVGAIDYNQADREDVLNVGAVIVTPGYALYDPARKGALGYGRYSNVVSNLQFERMLNAAGPYAGEVVRPSDHAHPKKVAFLQCVGSRDSNEEGKPYCSTVCCMASIKEAVIAREHDSEIQPTIFYIDMRTHGKGFERYFEDARNKHGIRFKRSSVAKIYEKAKTKNLVIRYADEERGGIVEDEFDLVVLAAGLTAKSGIEKLAESLSIHLNEHGFCEAGRHFDINNGVFMGGALTEPHDIPEAVVEGSSAASSAARILAPVRGTKSRKKKYPKQLDVAKQAPRIGVFVCRCGRNIASIVNVPEVVQYAATLPGVVHAGEFIYSCSQDSLEIIKTAIHVHKLNRVVVASCTPATHEYLFADTIREAGLNRYYFELASIREHCSWVHMAYPEQATHKAREIVEMMVRKVTGALPVTLKYSPVTKRGLVIGGGVSGMNSALSLAEQGFECVLVEKDAELGGNYLEHLIPVSDLYPEDYLQKLIASVMSNPNIKIHLNSEVIEFKGILGDFTATVCNKHNGDKFEEKCGAVIVAIGATERTPSEYGYGNDKRIMTQMQFEEILAKADENIAGVKNVVMIQCVGSREEPNMYCSRICCTNAIQNALLLKKRHPSIQIFILYRDIRTYGFREELYRKAREAGIIFIRYEREKKPDVNTLPEYIKVRIYDGVSRHEINIDADILVLSAGIAPREENEGLSKVLRVPLNGDGFFLEAHAKIRPVDFSSEGLFLAGLAHSPRFTNECVSQALAASVRAAAILSKDKIESKAEIVQINANRCSGCGLCITACPYEARKIDEETGKAIVVDVLCQGCGGCVAVCPNKASDQNLFRHMQIMQMLEPVGKTVKEETD